MRPRTADWYRAPVKVAAIDLAQGVPDLQCDGYDRVAVFVRYQARPIGWVVLEDVRRGEVTSEALREALARKLTGRLVTGVLGPSLAAPPQRSSPPVSVVVCTRDRAELLAGCLVSLLDLEYPEYEVLVVDNAPADDTTARLVAGLPVRYVREDRPGLDWARNRGIAEARHEIVAFIDDDARADGGWLTALAAAFDVPEVAAVTGLVMPLELETRAQVLFEWVYGGMGKGMAPRMFRAVDLKAAERIGVHAFGVGTNMAFRRSVLASLGGFDTALDVGTPSRGGGDLDMFHRAIESGHTLRYEPSALVWHRHRRHMRALRRQLESDGRAFGVYLIKRWNTHSVPRIEVALSAFHWGAWMLGRLRSSLLRRSALPLQLAWALPRGAMTAPWAYAATCRRDRRLRSTDDVDHPLVGQRSAA